MIVNRFLVFLLRKFLLLKCLNSEVIFVMMNNIAHGEIVKIIAKLEKKAYIDAPGYIISADFELF